MMPITYLNAADLLMLKIYCQVGKYNKNVPNRLLQLSRGWQETIMI